MYLVVIGQSKFLMWCVYLILLAYMPQNSTNYRYNSDWFSFLHFWQIVETMDLAIPELYNLICFTQNRWKIRKIGVDWTYPLRNYKAGLVLYRNFDKITKLGLCLAPFTKQKKYPDNV